MDLIHSRGRITNCKKVVFFIKKNVFITILVETGNFRELSLVDSLSYVKKMERIKNKNKLKIHLALHRHSLQFKRKLNRVSIHFFKALQRKTQ